uniref:Uncharacterized protein n=1 Tax=Arundo donax TaxID=35708 RepID=A0A0A8XU40_ARUDO
MRSIKPWIANQHLKDPTRKKILYEHHAYFVKQLTQISVSVSHVIS